MPDGTAIAANLAAGPLADGDLRDAVAESTILVPGAFNPLVGRMIEQAGFEAMYLSGGAFSAGTLAPFRRQGKTKIFLAHGTRDEQMPIDRTGRKFAADLKADGYDITYREYDGGHGAPPDVVREGFDWFVKSPAAKG